MVFLWSFVLALVVDDEMIAHVCRRCSGDFAQPVAFLREKRGPLSKDAGELCRQCAKANRRNHGLSLERIAPATGRSGPLLVGYSQQRPSDRATQEERSGELQIHRLVTLLVNVPHVFFRHTATLHFDLA
jgi:hypothetical protein